MARIEYSPLITKISGSVGKATFQEGPGGSILRNKPYKPVANTMFQTRHQAYFARFSTMWKNLSQTEKDHFKEFCDAYPVYMLRNTNRRLSPRMQYIKYYLLYWLCFHDYPPALEFKTPIYWAPFVQFYTALWCLQFRYSSPPDISNLYIQMSIARWQDSEYPKISKVYRPLWGSFERDPLPTDVFSLSDACDYYFHDYPPVGSYINYRAILIGTNFPYISAPYYGQSKVISSPWPE